MSTVRQGWGFGLKSLTHPRWLLAEDAPLIVDDLLRWPPLWASRRLHLAIDKHTDLSKRGVIALLRRHSYLTDILVDAEVGRHRCR